MTEYKPEIPGILSACFYIIKRELVLAFRRKQDLVNPLLFALVTVMLFTLGVSPEKAFLVEFGGGILWVVALLATMLSFDSLFKQDYEDGTLEQMILSPQPLFLQMLAKVIAHWMTTGLPLVVLSPFLGLLLQQDAAQVEALMLGLLVGTPILSLMGSVGAALTVGLRTSGVLISILILPLFTPVLVFGVGVVAAATQGTSFMGLMFILGALLALAVSLAPIATAAALRIGLSQ